MPPETGDLAVTQPLKNQTYFVNFVWDWRSNVQLGLQVDNRETGYREFGPNVFLDSEAVLTSSRFLWTF